MKGRKLGIMSAAAGLAGFIAAAGRAWSGAAKEAWRVDEELSFDEVAEEVSPERRPFLPLLTGQDTTEGRPATGR